jgi:hypothetical protein
MKAMILFLLLALVTSRCSDHSVNPEICHEGTVIGKIRSWGGGIAVSMKEPTFSSHEWHGFENVVEALNLPYDLKPGEKIYFFARLASENESTFPVSSDGDESSKPIIFVLEFSSVKCPAIDD